MIPTEAELVANCQTWEHIDRIRMLLRIFAVELLMRGESHDRSKLRPPESSMFAEFSPKLKSLTYGSEEYKQALKDMGPALLHHYDHNRHHPEHHEGGIAGMDLIDLNEMFIDWWASTMRTANGDIDKSIEHAKERWGLNDQLAQVFHNTARRYKDRVNQPLPTTQRENQLGPFNVGVFCRVKQEVWKDYCVREQKEAVEPKPQPITQIGSHPPFEGYVMLAFPFRWWKKEELEIVDG